MATRGSIKIPQDKNSGLHAIVDSREISLSEVAEMMVNDVKLRVYDEDNPGYGVIEQHFSTSEYREDVTIMLCFEEIVNLTNMLARHVNEEVE